MAHPTISQYISKTHQLLLENQGLRKKNLEADIVNRVIKLAHDFWNRVVDDERISEEFRDFLNKRNPADHLRP